MTPYLKLKIAIGLLIVLLGAGYYWFEISEYFFLIIPFLYFSVVAYGSATIQANFFLNSICSIPTSEKIISITFDDGPDEQNTPRLLDVLKESNVKATFFIIGKKIKDRESIVQRIHQEGHIIGNHSYAHSYVYDFYSTAIVEDDIMQFNKQLYSVLAIQTQWFRPPYGVTNPNIAKALKKQNLISIGWNVRSLDTVIQNKDTLNQRVISRIKPGSILLFHDTGKYTLDTLKEVILFTQKNGYKIVGLDKLLNKNPYKNV
jgi:peptidoglycan/xylan/chitin deacetylase (PgdA/CDA1 family)